MLTAPATDPGQRLLARALEAHQAALAAEAKRRADRIADLRAIVAADAQLAVARLLATAEAAEGRTIVDELPVVVTITEDDLAVSSYPPASAFVSVGEVVFWFRRWWVSSDGRYQMFLRANLRCGAADHAHQSPELHGLADLGAFAATLADGCPTRRPADDPIDWDNPFSVPYGVVPLGTAFAGAGEGAS